MKNQEYDRLLSPSPAEFTLLLIELFAPLIWRIRNFSPTTHLCNMLGHGFDPNGSRLPEWNLKEDRQPIPISEEIEIRGGGPVGYGKDGMIYAQPATKAHAIAEKQVKEQVEITPEEWEAMKNHNPPLLNIALAGKIKKHLLDGKSDYEAAILAGCSQSYARHHRLAFQKASKTA